MQSQQLAANGGTRDDGLAGIDTGADRGRRPVEARTAMRQLQASRKRGQTLSGPISGRSVVDSRPST